VIIRLAKEPFVHFLVLGALIFVAYAWLDGGRTAQDPNNRIVIDQGELDHLKNLWKLQWKRDPAPSDVAAIIDRHLRQEVFYREALKMNLDHNDGIIKKRLAQKMEAVADDLSKLTRPPTDEQLREYYESRQDFFTLPKAYAFKQILFLPDEKKGMEATLVSLRQGATIPPDRLNKLSVPAAWSLTSVRDIENAFGGAFSEALDDLPVGAWSGPVRSGYGWHLVFIQNKEQARVPDFEEVRDYVAREYEYRSALETQDQVYKDLLQKYEVSITAGDVPDKIKAEFAR
jgi:peptidyl-prolyl cis-trans isomerase C